MLIKLLMHFYQIEIKNLNYMNQLTCISFTDIQKHVDNINNFLNPSKVNFSDPSKDDFTKVKLISEFLKEIEISVEEYENALKI